MTEVLQAIEIAQQESIQKRGKGMGDSGNVYVLNYLNLAGTVIPPWWSEQRDKRLRDFWKVIDHLSGSVYSMTSKMTAIPNKVVARDPTNKRHIKEAEILTDIISGSTEFGETGWTTFYSKFVEDLITQDNGAFAEIIAPGNKAQGILGRPISLAHLDSAQCRRTGDPIYPVVYRDIDGKMYKLHFTRVFYTSQMTSPIAKMFGVGFCAISRCINVAQTLYDILIYKQEKLGSRPLREILITQGGLDPGDLRDAFQLAEAQMDSQGLSRYAKVVVGGASALQEAAVQVVKLNELPEGFDELSSITLGMATIALAFGVDARDLFPAMQSGATRADALLQHLKQRGKGPGQILQQTEAQMNYKFVPPYLKFLFDFQDDAQDKQEAEIREIRANKRVQDTATGSVSQRVMREQMVSDGDITQNQFDRMELESGRLPDGNSVLVLFYSKKPEYSRLLKMKGVEDPLDVNNNDPIMILDLITEKRKKAMEIIADADDGQEKFYAELAKSALDQLELEYTPEMPMGQSMIEAGAKPPAEGNEDRTAKIRPNWVDGKIRRVDVRTPVPQDYQQHEGFKTPDDQPL